MRLKCGDILLSQNRMLSQTQRLASLRVGKVKLMMQEEFDAEGGVDKMAFAKYLDEVLPVMTLQDERLEQQMAAAPDDETAQKLLGVMFHRTKVGRCKLNPVYP